MDQVNILIIGGGVVGCAIAAEVSKRWQDVFVVEQLPRVGMATSTRNSGVIHSGIYYSAEFAESPALRGRQPDDVCLLRKTSRGASAAPESWWWPRMTSEQAALEALYKRGRKMA